MAVVLVLLQVRAHLISLSLPSVVNIVKVGVVVLLQFHAVGIEDRTCVFINSINKKHLTEDIAVVSNSDFKWVEQYILVAVEVHGFELLPL